MKKYNSDIKIYAIEPEESPLITKGYAAPHGLQGIGANFIPKNLDLKFVDKVVTVSVADSLDIARRLAQQEGIFCGISSGANVKYALELSKLPENKGKLIVTTITDCGERYLSTALFDDEEKNAD